VATDVQNPAMTSRIVNDGTPSRFVPAMPLVDYRFRRHRNIEVPFPLNEPAITFWYNARAAIHQGARALGLNAGQTVLVPAYSCGSEADALLKAGLGVRYFRVQPDLSPDYDHLRRLTDEGRFHALLITHYFGFAQDMDAVVKFASDRGLAVIEDNAHGLYSLDHLQRRLGSLGDIGIFSFSKSLALPDGGALLVNHPSADGLLPTPGRPPQFLPVAGKMKHLLEQAAARRAPGLTADIKRHVLDPCTASLKRVLTNDSTPAMDEHIREKSLTELRLERADWTMSRVARLLLARVDHVRIPSARRRNFVALLTATRNLRRTRSLFDSLPEGCCPMFYPIVVDEPVKLQRFLATRNIFCKRFWSFFHDSLPERDFPDESRLKRTVLALPIHQDLGEGEMAVIASQLEAWDAATGDVARR
jgi:dTDP-4-amino-4,6-dideoxygalactose transaminase